MSLNSPTEYITRTANELTLYARESTPTRRPSALREV